MKNMVKSILPTGVLRYWREIKQSANYSTRSYSQEGEDLILKRLMGDRTCGYYVDVGAHHPKRFSNTYLFYRRGWRGVNIDAIDNMASIFDRSRPRDINIEAALSSDGRRLNYRVFDDAALNTLNDDNANWAIKQGYRVLKQRIIETQTLAAVLNAYLKPGQAIDFMSVDVEGMDLEVLMGNDWVKYRPAYIVAEAFGISWNSIAELPLNVFMESIGYSRCAKTVNSVIYERIK
jgi:FkbM family methyltransferase